MSDNLYENLNFVNSFIWENLVNGSIKKNIPFNCPAFATLNKKTINIRTMILRHVDKEKKFLRFYTDKRSSKVKDIKKNNNVSIYFYDIKKRIQLICLGICYLENNTSNSMAIWKTLNQYSKTNYNSSAKPGTIIINNNNNKKLELNDKKSFSNFTLINVKIKSIEWLRLSRKNNKRALFKYKNKKFIEGKWLVP